MSGPDTHSTEVSSNNPYVQREGIGKFGLRVQGLTLCFRSLCTGTVFLLLHGHVCDTDCTTRRVPECVGLYKVRPVTPTGPPT